MLQRLWLVEFCCCDVLEKVAPASHWLLASGTVFVAAGLLLSMVCLLSKDVLFSQYQLRTPRSRLSFMQFPAQNYTIFHPRVPYIHFEAPWTLRDVWVNSPSFYGVYRFNSGECAAGLDRYGERLCARNAPEDHSLSPRLLYRIIH